MKLNMYVEMIFIQLVHIFLVFSSLFKLYIALNYFTITTANAYHTLHKLSTVLRDVRDFISLNLLLSIIYYIILSIIYYYFIIIIYYIISIIILY